MAALRRLEGRKAAPCLQLVTKSGHSASVRANNTNISDRKTNVDLELCNLTFNKKNYAPQVRKCTRISRYISNGLEGHNDVLPCLSHLAQKTYYNTVKSSFAV